MGRIFANVLSVVLHPLLMATLLFLTLLFFAPVTINSLESKAALSVLFLIFFTTFIVPVLSVLVMKWTQTISSVQMYSRRERMLPFSFILVYYAVTAYLFVVKIQAIPILNVIFCGTTAIILVVTLITYFFKVSVHSAGALGLVGFLWALQVRYPHSDLLWPLVTAIILAGMVMSSRLYLRAHSVREVYTGATIGLLLSYFSVYFYT